MEILNTLYLYLDALLVAPFRLFSVPIAGFYFGTLVLCMWCILLGELTFRIANWANRAHMNKLRGQAVRMHNLSIKAISLKDKENYRSCNKQANEAFGKYFFNMITQGAAFLWPVPFALAWMGTRFTGVEFELPFPLPIIGDTMGFAVVPVNMYILCRIFWGKLRHRLPFFHQGPKVGLDEGEEEMISWAELEKSRGLPARFWNNGESPEEGKADPPGNAAAGHKNHP
ncbi:MAG: hypothetical protein V2I32_13020 [Desulforhopalus sp.]|jgi:hypothetical protein|nr:hypothetical protein [Desulforhopalus sp.]